VKLGAKPGRERTSRIHRWAWAARTPLNEPVITVLPSITANLLVDSVAAGQFLVFPPWQRSCPWGVVSFDLAAMSAGPDAEQLRALREKERLAQSRIGQQTDRPSPGDEKASWSADPGAENRKQGHVHVAGGLGQALLQKSQAVSLERRRWGENRTSTAVLPTDLGLHCLFGSFADANRYQPRLRGVPPNIAWNFGVRKQRARQGCRSEQG